MPILFGRVPREARRKLLNLRDLRNRCSVRDTAELILLCLHLISSHLESLQTLSNEERDRFSMEISKAFGNVSRRIDRIANFMWLINKVTGMFSENSSDPYGAAAFQQVQM